MCGGAGLDQEEAHAVGRRRRRARPAPPAARAARAVDALRGGDGLGIEPEARQAPVRAVGIVDGEGEAREPFPLRVEHGVQPGGDRPIARRRDQLHGEVLEAEAGDLRTAAVGLGPPGRRAAEERLVGAHRGVQVAHRDDDVVEAGDHRACRGWGAPPLGGATPWGRAAEGRAAGRPAPRVPARGRPGPGTPTTSRSRIRRGRGRAPGSARARSRSSGDAACSSRRGRRAPSDRARSPSRSAPSRAPTARPAGGYGCPRGTPAGRRPAPSRRSPSCGRRRARPRAPRTRPGRRPRGARRGSATARGCAAPWRAPVRTA